MKIDNRVDLLEVFREKEKQTVMRVLEKYQVNNILTIKKARSAYKVETTLGILCLKKMRHGIQKAKNGSVFVEELFKIGFYHTPQYLKTSDESIFVKYKNWVFYVTQWIDGSECNLSNISEAENCMKLLANFHLACYRIDSSRLKIKNTTKNWSEIFSSNILQLVNFKKTIENKKLKTEFDSQYYKFVDNYISKGNLALEILNSSNYYYLSKEALDKKTICHDSFYYQNILKKDNEYYIIDLDSIIFDLPINDVGKIVRRLMYKNEYQWNFNKAKLLIEAYNSKNKLSKNELEAMLALIIFPHKFGKLGKKRYVKYKNWTEFKYMHKLNRLIKYNELQQQFLEDYLNYLSSYV